MLKKLLLLPLLLTSLMLVLVGCKPEVIEEIPELEAPKVNSVSVSTNQDTAGSVMVYVVAVDDDAKIYYVVIGETAAAPTAKQVKAGADYGGVTVLASGNGTGALLDKPDGLEGATTYQVAIVLEKTLLFSDVIVRSAITLTVEDTVDKGDGSELNPFWVETVSDLEKVGSGDDGFYNNLYYVLKNDLDLTAAGYGESGMSWTPLGRQYGLNTKFALL